MIFETAEDFHKYCKHCFVELEGKLVFVNRGDGRHFVIHDFTDKEGKVVEFKPLETEVLPPLLGYCNIGKKAEYLSRLPLREWNVGFNGRNSASRGLFDKYNYDQIYKGLVQIKTGQYPSIPDAIFKLTKEGYSNVAISRQYALSRKFLFFAGDRVGDFDIKTREVNVNSQSSQIFHSNNFRDLGVPLIVSYHQARNMNDYRYDYDI